MPASAEPATASPPGPRIVPARALSPAQREAARRHFRDAVFPALTPLAVDPAHPFPRLRAGAVNLAVSLARAAARGRRGARAHLLAIVQLPPELPRLVPLPFDDGPAFALLEDVVAAEAGALFPGHAVRETAAFRLTRGPGSTLEVAEDAPGSLEAALAAALRLEPGAVRRSRGPLPPAGAGAEAAGAAARR